MTMWLVYDGSVRLIVWFWLSAYQWCFSFLHRLLKEVCCAWFMMIWLAYDGPFWSVTLGYGSDSVSATGNGWERQIPLQVVTDKLNNLGACCNNHRDYIGTWNGYSTLYHWLWPSVAQEEMVHSIINVLPTKVIGLAKFGHSFKREICYQFSVIPDAKLHKIQTSCHSVKRMAWTIKIC